MKKIILKSLTMVNFKGEKERTTNFNDDVTTISGANGLGKSRHFDAFIWLLFGKDVQDRKDYEIKTRVKGEELREVECSVSATLEIDGEELHLKRAFLENWVKPQGQVERIFKGNRTECWWNGVPVKVTDYTNRIEAIIDSTLFKMITNPKFFVNMDWKLQREQLFQLAGTLSDEEIVAKNPEYKELLDKISGKSLADFKTQLSATKKRLRGELDQIQPRIDQTHKIMPEAEDFKAIENEIEKIDEEIAKIDKIISDVTASIRKKYGVEQAKQEQINILESECQQILFKAKEAAQERVFKAKEEAQKANYEANANRRELDEKLSSKNHELDLATRQLQAYKEALLQLEQNVEQTEKEQSDLREKWFEENKKVYNGETICTSCGQDLPQSMIDSARDIFAKGQIKKCEDITAKGKALGESIKKYQANIKKTKNSQQEVQSRLDNLEVEIQQIKDEINTLPEVKPIEPSITTVEVVATSIPEWVENQKKIKEIQATISIEESDDDSTQEHQDKKAELNAQRGEWVAKLSKRDTIAKCEKEINDLEKKGKDLAQQIADLEREEYTIEQFTKTKIEESESRINSMFKFVSFKLFTYTLDGNAVETCIPVVGDAFYPSANTASQLNAGLDIINTLCRFYGICAPIFIDNRESVNEIIDTESQIINLVVTTDKVLTVK